MPLCRLRAGKKHYYRGVGKSPSKSMKLLTPGDEVELSHSQAKAWADKFEILGPTEHEAAADKAVKESAGISALEVVPAGNGKFNVRNKETLDNVNDKPLTKVEAEELAAV